MTVRLLADENFNNGVLRAVLRKVPGADILRVQDVGLMETPDQDILEWASKENRILLTHDVTTVTDFAYERLAEGKPLPGVFEIPRKIPIGRVVDDLILVLTCSAHTEWENKVTFFPL